MIKYLDSTITTVTHIETGETWYELSHWFMSDEKTDYAGRVHAGYFRSYDEAEKALNKKMVDALSEPEKIQ